MIGAGATKTLKRFREPFSYLFIQGYVICDPVDARKSGGLGGTAGPGGASGGATRADGVPFRTLTQIAMDQCKNSVTVKVGHRERRLPDILNERTTLRVMQEIRSVAQDVLRRMDADFIENSLYLCFEALDLSAWNTVAKCCRAGRLAATPVEDAHLAATKKRLGRKAKDLHRISEVDFDVNDFLRAVDVARGCMDNLPNTVAEHWRNRVAWADALASAQGPSNAAHKERYERHKESKGDAWVTEEDLKQKRADAPPREEVKGINHQTSLAKRLREAAKKAERQFKEAKAWNGRRDPRANPRSESPLLASRRASNFRARPKCSSATTTPPMAGKKVRKCSARQERLLANGSRARAGHCKGERQVLVAGDWNMTEDQVSDALKGIHGNWTVLKGRENQNRDWIFANCPLKNIDRMPELKAKDGMHYAIAACMPVFPRGATPGTALASSQGSGTRSPEDTRVPDVPRGRGDGDLTLGGAEVSEKGTPLFWAERKSVDF